MKTVITEESLKKTYSAIVDHPLSECERIAALTDLSPDKTIEYLERLCDAGLITARITAGKRTYSDKGVLFLVLDARAPIWNALYFNERLTVKYAVGYTPNRRLALYENMRCFFSDASRHKSFSKVVAICLIPPEKFDSFCLDVLPDDVAVKISEPHELAVQMAEKYVSGLIRSAVPDAERQPDVNKF